MHTSLRAGPLAGTYYLCTYIARTIGPYFGPCPWTDQAQVASLGGHDVPLNNPPPLYHECVPRLGWTTSITTIGVTNTNIGITSTTIVSYSSPRSGLFIVDRRPPMADQEFMNLEAWRASTK